MKKAKYQIEFDVKLYSKLKQDLSANLPDGSKVILRAPGGVINIGEIIFEIDQSNDLTARSEGEKEIKNLFRALQVVKNLKYEELNIKKPLFLNPEDFLGGVRTGSVTIQADTLIVGHLEQEELDQAVELLSRIRELPKREQDLLLKALSWFERGTQSKGEDQFIFWWISFDSLLGLLNKKKTAPHLIPEFLDIYLRSTSLRVLNKHQQIIDDLSNAQLVSFGGVDRSKELNDELQQSTSPPIVILIKVALCIYEVRNDLFHGGVSSKLLQGSTALLADIIRETIKAYTNIR